MVVSDIDDSIFFVSKSYAPKYFVSIIDRYIMAQFDEQIDDLMVELRDLKIPESMAYASDQDMMRFRLRRLLQQPKIDDDQSGGNGSTDQFCRPKMRESIYTYEKNRYIVRERTDKYGRSLAILRESDDSQSCMHMMIDDSENNYRAAYLQNISRHSDCALQSEYQVTGNSLLRLSLSLAKKYDVKRIQLKDNSTYLCKPRNKKLLFPLMHTLLWGNTWYGKYGFRPYDPDRDEEDVELAKIYDENKNIVRMTKVADTNLFNYLSEIFTDDKTKTEAEIKNIVDRYYAKYSNHTISEFFRTYLSEFDRACSAFSLFYLGFAKNNDIYNFYGHSFYLDLDN